MERLLLDRSNMETAAAEAARVIRAGGVVLYPTDTLYGLGVDAFSDEAVAKLYAIKGRDWGKPMHALVDSADMAAQYGRLNDMARNILRRLPQGKLSLIVPKRDSDVGICRGLPTFGFRIPDDPFCLMLVQALGSPMTATSANVSGQETKRRAADIVEQLGPAAAGLALVIDGGELPERLPSTVVDLSKNEPVILREGAIPAADVWDAIRQSY